MAPERHAMCALLRRLKAINTTLNERGFFICAGIHIGGAGVEALSHFYQCMPVTFTGQYRHELLFHPIQSDLGGERLQAIGFPVVGEFVPHLKSGSHGALG